MSDVYIPGVKSRFNTEKIIDDLMKLERVPRDRVAKDVEDLETQKTYWQEVGRRITSLRDSAKLLYSFQNPFNDRIVVSQDESVLTGTATRNAVEQERSFTVKQIARSDRFLSAPLDRSFRVEGGTYTFSVGEDEISFSFRGGSLRDFADALNRRGRDKIRADLVAVDPETHSLLIESLVTGAEKRLGFSGEAEKLALETGMIGQSYNTRRDLALNADTVRGPELRLEENVLTVAAGGRNQIYPGEAILSEGMALRFEAATRLLPGEHIPAPPAGPSIPDAGSISYGGVTIENDLSSVPLPVWVPPEMPKRVDDLGILSLTFTDGTKAPVPPIRDSQDFASYQYDLSGIAGGKTIASMELVNNNTNRDVSIRNIRILDPRTSGGANPLNAISTAQDAVVVMDGIEVRRPANEISDLIPGVTITARNPSDRPVKLGVQPDRESIKEAIITLTGNYNRLVAELNVLTRQDDRIVEELTYLSPEEQGELKKRMGAFQGDTGLNQLKANLQRAAASPYPTAEERALSMLAQIGIGTDVRRAGASSGYDASRLRGYLEIDEKVLDGVLASKLPAVQQLFGSDSDGDLIADTGVAIAIDGIVKPFVETGGLITLKTGTIDTKISQEQRRMDTMDRQLAAKEASLKIQYGTMEGAYNRMERMSTSLDQFSRQNSNNR
ncbi:MAG: flagellar filament capping protein FliD [Treponema sp.]|nr:flagellar filament capping protein FliD [Treponema sp.]